MRIKMSLVIFLLISSLLFKAEAQGPDNVPVEIVFEIQSEQLKNGRTHTFCDHKIGDTVHQNMYTVLEGEEFRITRNYDFSLFFCHGYNNSNDLFDSLRVNMKAGLRLKTVTTFKAQKKMGTLWNCTVLDDMNDPTMLPVVHYKGDNYSTVHNCYMKIHVKQKKSPQTILVNNMVLQAARTDLSEKDIDFTAKYQYVDGDVVNVTCVNFLNRAPLTMEYAMAGTMSDKSTMKKLSSHNAIGFVAKLHAGHNNSYMICTKTESTDYSKVMVRFVMRTELPIVSVSINGMTLRPILKNDLDNSYEIEYKYLSHQLTTVMCEVPLDSAMNLVMLEIDTGAGDGSSYQKTELIPGKKAEMSYYYNDQVNKSIHCASDIRSGLIVTERVSIHFTAGNFRTDLHPLHMELPSKGIVMEFYDDKRKIIFYEFEDGETLQLKCGPLFVQRNEKKKKQKRQRPEPVLYLQIEDSDKCKNNGCVVSKTLNVTRKDENAAIVCHLKEQGDPSGPSKEDKVLKEIRVILRERILTTTSTTTTPTSTTTTPTSTTTTPTSTTTTPTSTTTTPISTSITPTSTTTTTPTSTPTSTTTTTTTTTTPTSTTTTTTTTPTSTTTTTTSTSTTTTTTSTTSSSTTTTRTSTTITSTTTTTTSPVTTLTTTNTAAGPASK